MNPCPTRGALSRTAAFLPVLLFGLILVASAGCGDEEADPATAPVVERPDLLEAMQQAGNLNTFGAAITLADQVERLRTAGPFTVLAPTDEAFQQLSPAVLDSILTRPVLARMLVQHHIVDGRIVRLDSLMRVLQARGADTLRTDSALVFQGDTTGIAVRLRNGRITVDGADVLGTLEAANGLVHIIDSVLVPPELTRRLRGDTLAPPAAPVATGP